jgi:hemoglobin/transferrin/lactoferrin receptor protein
MQFLKWSSIFTLFIALSANAEDMEDSSESDSVEPDMETVVVVASKRPRPLAEVVGQVSVINAEFIEKYLVENADDLFRYEPGISLEGSGTRFGSNAVNIRGIGGNRVAIEVDGVPVRDRFTIGNFSDGGRNTAETDRIKQVEILYGPASTLYGSDALGGIMTISTWDPADLLAMGNGNSRYSLRGGYQSVNNSLVGSGMAAWGNDTSGFMLAGTWRDGHEMDNQASAGAPQDKQDWNSQDYFARYTYDTESGNRLRFSLSDYQREVTSNIESLPGNGRFINTTSLQGDDKDENRQLSFDYQFSGGWADGVFRAYDVSSSTKQTTFEERAKGSRPVYLERYFQYEQDFSGLELNLFKDFSTGGTEHYVGAGIEFQQTDSSELRDGYQQNLITGSITNVVLGEEMPVRDFPNSRTRELGIYIQDEISFGQGRWELVPALRYDVYKLDPKPDEIYLQDNPDTEVVKISEDNLSPRLGLLYHVNDDFSIYAQYANGFRAPPFEDANIGLDIPLFNIRAIPNPDLKSETSDGTEIGFRYMTGTTFLSLAIFNTHFDDFIETKALIGRDPQTGTLLFQSRNIDSARIYGLDLRLEQDLASWNPSLENWTLKSAAYWSRGKNQETNQPLNSVSPPQLVLGLAWSSSDGHWDANLAATFTAAQDEVDESAGELFQTPSWTTLDFTVAWHISPNFDLRAAVYNLTDETYWRWSDVNVFAPDNPMIELLSRPGRNFSVSAIARW